MAMLDQSHHGQHHRYLNQHAEFEAEQVVTAATANSKKLLASINTDGSVT